MSWSGKTDLLPSPAENDADELRRDRRHAPEDRDCDGIEQPNRFEHSPPHARQLLLELRNSGERNLIDNTHRLVQWQVRQLHGNCIDTDGFLAQEAARYHYVRLVRQLPSEARAAAPRTAKAQESADAAQHECWPDESSTNE